MPINLSCEKCSRKLRVGDNLAGKKIKCPGCQNVITVPAESAPSPVEEEPTVNINSTDLKAALAKKVVGPTAADKASSGSQEKIKIDLGISDKAETKRPAVTEEKKVDEKKIVVTDKKTSPAAKAETKPTAPAKESAPAIKTTASKPAAGKPAAAKPAPAPESYYVKTEDEEYYGPVKKTELDEWAAEGRLTTECQLLRDGEDQWVWATDIYPDLEAAAQEEDAAADEEAPGFDSLKEEEAEDESPLDDERQEEEEDEEPVVSKRGGRASKKAAASVKKKKRLEPEDEDEEEESDDDEVSDRAQLTAGLLAIFLGGIGAHRFYLGYVLHGVLMFVTCGGFFVWQIIDIVKILTGKLPDANGRKLKQ